MSGKKLLPGFADDDDDEDMIKSTETDITTLFRECEKRLRKMGQTKSEGAADEVRAARPPRRGGARCALVFSLLPRAHRGRASDAAPPIASPPVPRRACAPA
jgi:hypothetical protein